MNSFLYLFGFVRLYSTEFINERFEKKKLKLRIIASVCKFLIYGLFNEFFRLYRHAETETLKNSLEKKICYFFFYLQLLKLEFFKVGVANKICFNEIRIYKVELKEE